MATSVKQGFLQRRPREFPWSASWSLRRHPPLRAWRKSTSRVSRLRGTDSGRARPNVYGLVPSVPSVPTEKNRRATISFVQPRVWLLIEKECSQF